MIDLHPAAERTAAVLAALTDEQLVLTTPCPGSSVGDLVDHLATFADRFTDAATKAMTGPAGAPPPPSAANLAPGWREQMAADLRALADAWGDPEAWTGTTYAGGLEMPADVVGLVALDELVVHGWDLAVASGQAYAPTEAEIDAAAGFVASFPAPRDGGLFGPIVEVGPDAPALDRLLGLAGRDPAWTPPTA